MHRKIFRTARTAVVAFAVLVAATACEQSPTAPDSAPGILGPSSQVPEAAYAWFQGFEVDTDGWFDNGGTIHRESSGYLSGGYADGILSAHGGFHARLDAGACTINCSGPFTRWGGYGLSNVPYITEIDIYLDTAWAAGRPDVRFDFSSAINNSDGNHRRDFVFNAGTDPAGAPQFIVSASNGAGRANSFPSNPGRAPVTITDSGWYTFRHTFRDQGGVLAVDLNIIDHTGLVRGQWTLSDPSDVMTVIGGNRYGWFVNQEIDEMAIDHSGRIDGDTPPTAPGDPQTKDDCMSGGWEQYGFKNQGLCIQFVNTGKDSR